MSQEYLPKRDGSQGRESSYYRHSDQAVANYSRHYDEAVINANTYRQVYEKKVTSSIPDEEEQLKESLANLASGNYRDIPIDKYLKEIEE